MGYCPRFKDCPTKKTVELPAWGYEFKQRYKFRDPSMAAARGNEIIQREFCKSCIEECPAYQASL